MDEVLTRGQRAYELYQRRRHISWPGVARCVGYSCAQAAVHAARRHARLHGLPWPLAESVEGVPHGQLGRACYERYRVTRRTWHQVAVDVGAASGPSAQSVARQYAQRTGRPWPVQRYRRPDR